jgi:hypothetical protein
MKPHHLVFLFLLLCTTVVASGGIAGEETTFWCEYINNSYFYDAGHANITIYYPNGSIWVQNESATKIDDGRYIYQKNTTNETGNYYYYCDFYYNGSVVAISSEQTEIKTSTVESVEEGLNLSLSVLSLFAIGILLAVYAQYSKDASMFIASGVWFIITAFSGLGSVVGAGFVSTLFFIIVGLGIAYRGIVLIAGMEE